MAPFLTSACRTSARWTLRLARRSRRPKRPNLRPPPRETSRSPRGRLPSMTDVTRILSAIVQGDPRAAEQLLPVVYDELRQLAAQRLAHEAPGQTLQATAIVHEACLRLVDGGKAQHWNGRGHFFAAAAEAMRRIPVENARRKQTHKHGGDRQRLALDAEALVAPEANLDLLDLDAALDRLAGHDPLKAK